jgi:hypothetical protein
MDTWYTDKKDHQNSKPTATFGRGQMDNASIAIGKFSENGKITNRPESIQIMKNGQDGQGGYKYPLVVRPLCPPDKMRTKADSGQNVRNSPKKRVAKTQRLAVTFGRGNHKKEPLYAHTEMHTDGMTYQAIADSSGVGKGTVVRAVGPNGPTQPEFTIGKAPHRMRAYFGDNATLGKTAKSWANGDNAVSMIVAKNLELTAPTINILSNKLNKNRKVCIWLKAGFSMILGNQRKSLSPEHSAEFVAEVQKRLEALQK